MIDDTLFAVLVLVAGACLASFINVMVAGGGTIKENLARKRSHCDNCKKQLVWWELVPILSWIFLLGRCSKCKKKVSVFHPLSELFLGGFLVLSLLQSEGNVALFAFYSLAILVLYVFAIFDIDKGIVPNELLLVLIPVGFVGVVGYGIATQVTVEFYWDRMLAAGGYFLFFALVNFLSRSGVMPGVKKGREGFGWGDAKLALLIGLLLGGQATLLSGWIAVFSGALVGVILLLRYRKSGMKMPFVPYMAVGAVVALLYSEQILLWVRNYMIY